MGFHGVAALDLKVYPLRIEAGTNAFRTASAVPPIGTAPLGTAAEHRAHNGGSLPWSSEEKKAR